MALRALLRPSEGVERVSTVPRLELGFRARIPGGIRRAHVALPGSSSKGGSETQEERRPHVPYSVAWLVGFATKC